MEKQQSATRAAKSEESTPAVGATIEQTRAALEDISAKSQARIMEIVGADPIMREFDGMRKALLFVIEGPQETENGVDEEQDKK